MSAIFGLYHLHGYPVHDAMLQQMDHALASAGPDGYGLWHKGAVGLGHRLLYTTPESVYEHLPLVASQGGVVLTADARLDNRAALIRDLALPLSAAANLPDSALVLKAFHAWGERCPEHLVGDFAFVIWDETTRTLFCARDPMGIKPLYYCHRPGQLLAFASEIAGLLSLPEVPRRLDPCAAAAHLVYQPEDAQTTLFRDIARLPPAHTLRVQDGQVTLRRYWLPALNHEIRLGSDEAYSEALREHLLEAIHCRLRSLYPVGSHITGGLDSSTITCVAAASLRRQGRTLVGMRWLPLRQETACHADEAELSFIAELCTHAGTTCQAPMVNTADMYQTLLCQRGLPGAMPPLAPIIAMHDQVRSQGVRVLLSGWGGDEGVSFNGRGYWSGLVVHRQWRQLSRELAALPSIRSRLGVLKNRILAPFVPDALWWSYRRWCGQAFLDDLVRWSYIHPDFARRMAISERLTRRLPRERPGVRVNQYRLLTHGHLLKRLERWSSEATRCGMEYRYPLLDQRLLEFALALPAEQYMQEGWDRYVFRRAADGILPPRIQWRRDKRDPLSERQYDDLKNGLWPFIKAYLAVAAHQDAVRDLVDMPKLQRHLDLLISGKRCPAEQAAWMGVGIYVAVQLTAFVNRYIT